MSTDEQPDQPQQEKQDSAWLVKKLSHRLFPLWWTILGALTLAAILTLILTLALPHLLTQPPDTPKQPSAVIKPSTPLIYEEPLAVDLQAQAIQADAILMRVLIELDTTPDSIESYAFPAKGEEYFRARSIGFSLKATPERFAARLGKLMAEHLPKALLTRSGPRQYSIIINSVRTHELFLSLPLPAAPGTAAPGTTAPDKPTKIMGRLAIVIDDLGEDAGLAHSLAGLGLDLTFAVWPQSTHKNLVVQLAIKNQLDLLLHQPMEPVGYPAMEPGPDALFTTMTASEIAAIVNRNLDLVPQAIGMNNHMGSRFTADLPAMTAALAAVHQRGLFFLDSRTTGKSQGATAARNTKTTFYERDIFIDNQKNIRYIKRKLKQAEALARRQGFAVAIGHPHPQTLAAIREWATEKPGDVIVVPLSSLAPLEP